MTSELKGILDTLVAMAPALREAGVKELAFNGLAVKLAPHEPEVEQAEETVEPDNYADPLADPALYGGQVPGFTLRSKQQ